MDYSYWFDFYYPVKKRLFAFIFVMAYTFNIFELDELTVKKFPAYCILF